MAETSVATLPTPEQSIASPIGERIAFNPFTPQQEIINEFIRNTINPDNDSGRLYYVGQVVKIIENDNIQVDNRDIFFSLSDNSERATKDTVDKNYNSQRVVLLVHIPSFITSPDIEASNLLNYDNFTKLRVEYDQSKRAIKPGNLVKIQFHVKNNLRFPIVVDFEDTTLDYIQKLSVKVKDEFNKQNLCNIPIFEYKANSSSTISNSSTRPFGGYVQAVKEIENIFSSSFISSFFSSLSEKEKKDFKGLNIKIGNISISPKVYSEFQALMVPKDQNIKITTFTSEDEITYKNELYLILGKEIKITCNNPNFNNDLRNKFYVFLKQEFDSKLGYTFLYDQNKNNALVAQQTPLVDFKLNINAYLSFEEGLTAATVDKYIEKSKKTTDFSTYYVTSPSAASDPKIIAAKVVIDSCQKEVAQENLLYPLVYNGTKFDSNYSSVDNDIVKAFYEKKLKQEDLLTSNFFYQLIKIKKEDLLNKDSKFYTNDSNSIDDYGISDPKASVNDIELQFKNGINFLNIMRAIIGKNENQIGEENVLIVPRKVLKIKEAIVPRGQDPNSRHYYGKAFDIAVYLLLDKKIVQIRPEIVLLYIEFTKNIGGTKIKKIGHGLFLKQKTKYYNHIEFLDGTQFYNIKNKSWEIINENERFVTGGETDIEKSLDSSTDKINKLKEIIKNSKEFKNPILNSLEQRFLNLVG